MSERSRRRLKRMLPDRAIRVLRAARGSLEDEAWSTTAAKLLDPTLRRLVYWPGGRQNPYLKLLYARLPEVGFSAGPLAHFDELDDLPGGAVFHLHWTRGAQLGATSNDEAEAMTRDYLAPIESFVERGGTLLWSVHEEAPHDTAFVHVEVRLRSRLAELASGIHVLHASTPGAVAELYALPADKVFVVEHPLYGGYYPRYVGRDAARRVLGIDDGSVLLVGFGALRPYKGFERLADLSSELEDLVGRSVDIIVAGPTMRLADIDDLEARAASHPRFTLSAGPVPEVDVQLLFEAADVVALPYRRVMNSGVLMLGLTFGRPCVAPRNPVTEDAAVSGLVHLFEPDSDASLVEALERAVTADHPDELPEEFVHRYDPFEIAGEFAGHLANVTGHTDPA